MKTGIFISYNSSNKGLALKVRDKLQILGQDKLDVNIAEEMVGSADWRQWILEKLQDSKVLVFLYTDEHLNWSWCFYELGIFHGIGTGKHVCIMNTDIETTPGPLTPWRVYKADEAGIKKFLTELLTKTVLTEVVINDSLHDDRYEAEFQQAVKEIAALFAQARIKTEYYGSRLWISSYNDGATPVPLRLESARLYGDADALRIFSLEGRVTWADFKAQCANMLTSSEWISQVERLALNNQHRDNLTSTLTLFARIPGATFIPVVSRRESVDGQLTRLYITLLAAETGLYRPFFYTEIQNGAMPAMWKDIIVLLDMARVTRWDILVPCNSALSRLGGGALTDEAKQIIQRSLDRLEALGKEATSLGFIGADRVAHALPLQQSDWIRTAFQRWSIEEQKLRQGCERDDRRQVEEALGTLTRMNAEFLLFILQRSLALMEERFNAAFDARPVIPNSSTLETEPRHHEKPH